MDSTDEKWMRHALQLARRAEALGEVPVGAVVVLDGNVIGEGWNLPISTHDCTAHAEIMALRNAGKHLNNYRLPNATLYVTIEPCLMCAGAIIHSRVSRLVYGAAESKAGVVQSQLQVLEQPFLNHSVNVSGGVLARECGERLSSFFKARRAEKKKS